MAYDDIMWGGFAKIIVDTSLLTVGDKVRVKSMTTGATYDKLVTAVGTPLIWDKEIFKDYIKVCQVADIGGVETEIGEQFVEADFGKIAVVELLVKSTLRGIKAILNLHLETDLLAIGDEVDIIQDGNSWTMVVAGINVYNSHEVIFISKYLTNSSYTAGANSYGSRTSVLNYLSAWYNAIGTADKECIAIRDVKYVYNNQGNQGTISQYVWIPSRYEVYGSGGGTTQFSIFTTQANRIRRTTNGTARMWMTTTCNTASQQGYTNAVNADGSETAYTNSACYMLPCFSVVADS